MDAFDVTIAGAFVAGLLSFVSPCVLPLVPPYLCFIGGVSLEQLTGDDGAPAPAGAPVLLAALAFVLGFTTVFVALGATATGVGRLVADHLDLLARVAGAVIVALGLHFLGVLRIGLLYREARYHVASKPAGLLGAYAIGLAFAFGWTPCVGPVLAAVLMVAGTEDTALRGSLLLGGYSLGIGLPFLAAALAAKPFMVWMARFRRHLGRVEKVMGALLVVTGVAFLTGSINEIGYWLLETFPSLGRVG